MNIVNKPQELRKQTGNIHGVLRIIQSRGEGEPSFVG